MQKLVYIADDEENIRDLMKVYIEREGFAVECFQDGDSLFEAYLRKKPDMIVLDIMMPGRDGLDICREIRKNSDTPIVMVSARDELYDKLIGLELGSDDYLAKPFSPRELVVRIKTILRRVKSSDEPLSPQGTGNALIKIKDIVMNENERSVYKDSVPLELTTKEYDFLRFMAVNKNRVFNREQILHAVWGDQYERDDRAVDDLVKRVRRKLSDNGSQVEIATVWGYGYKLIE